MIRRAAARRLAHSAPGPCVGRIVRAVLAALATRVPLVALATRVPLATLVALATLAAVGGCGAPRDGASRAEVRPEVAAAIAAATDSATFDGTVRTGLEDAPARRVLSLRRDAAGVTLVSEEDLRSGALRTTIALDPATLALRSLAATRAAGCGADSARITFTPVRVARSVPRCGTGARFDDFVRRTPGPLVAREALPLWLRAWLPDRAPGRDLRVALLPGAFDPPPFAPIEARLRVVDGGPVTVPAGTFDTWKVAVADPGGADVFWFERTTPHRLLLWETARGERWRREAAGTGGAR